MISLIHPCRIAAIIFVFLTFVGCFGNDNDGLAESASNSFNAAEYPQPFKVIATAESDSVAVGYPVKIFVHVQNLTNARHDVIIDGPLNITVHVSRPDGSEVPRTLINPRDVMPHDIGREHSYSGINLGPGDELIDTVVANSYYDMTVPGRYVVTAGWMFHNGTIGTAKPVTVDVEDFADKDAVRKIPADSGRAPQGAPDNSATADDLHPFTIVADADSDEVNAGNPVKISLHVQNRTNARHDVITVGRKNLIIHFVRADGSSVPRTLLNPRDITLEEMQRAAPRASVSLRPGTELIQTIIANDQYDMSETGQYVVTASWMYDDGTVVAAKPLTVTIHDFVDEDASIRKIPTGDLDTR